MQRMRFPWIHGKLGFKVSDFKYAKHEGSLDSC
jgi:hypothetical protein